MSAIILFVTGLVLCFVVATIFDAALVLTIASRHGKTTREVYYGSRAELDIIRPIALSLIVFGGGMLVTSFVSHSVLCDILGGLWFWLLTHLSCLRGPHESLKLAVRCMLHTMAAVALLYWLLV